MVTSECPACEVGWCVDQGIPPDPATMLELMNKWQILSQETNQRQAESRAKQLELIIRVMEQPGVTQDNEVKHGIREQDRSINEVQNLTMRSRRITYLLCHGGMLLDGGTKSSRSQYDQILQLWQRDQLEVLKLQDQQTQLHDEMIQRNIRALRGIKAAAPQNESRCTIL